VLSLGLKMLLRRRGTSLYILAMALLVAILASTTSIVNYVDSYAQALGRLVSPGRTYLIISEGATSITDSRLSAGLARELRALGYFDYVIPQRIVLVNATTRLGSDVVWARGVEDVGGFLKARGACLSGTTARGLGEAVVGEVLANALSVGLGDEILLAVGDKQIRVKVVGVFRSQTQSDAELLVSMDTINMLVGDGSVSFIELVLKKDLNNPKVIDEIAQLLPKDVKLVEVQQIKGLARQVGLEALSFLSAWSWAVYAAIVATSYAIASRFVVESSYELAMLRALGAKRSKALAIVLAYIAALTLAGSVLGIAMGTAGAQAISTMLRWIHPSIEVAPFLKVDQALQILLLALASSILGCAFPALKATRARYVEQQL